MQALEERHLADLRVQEVTRALRALSSVYVERRDALKRGRALDTRGKRAAFALFYGPLHFLITRAVVNALGADAGGPNTVVDLGCGTGTAGAAWALALGRRTRVLGFDRHPWAIKEAAWTYDALGLDGTARRQDVAAVRLKGRRAAVILAYTINELPDVARPTILEALLRAQRDGARVLVVEPIARPSGQWWEEWTAAFRLAGGREDTWRFEANLPERVKLFDRAAGLDHRVLTARTLYVE